MFCLIEYLKMNHFLCKLIIEIDVKKVIFTCII